MNTAPTVMAFAALVLAGCQTTSSSTNQAAATAKVPVSEIDRSCGDQSFDIVLRYRHSTKDSNDGSEGCLGLDESTKTAFLFEPDYGGGRTAQVQYSWDGNTLALEKLQYNSATVTTKPFYFDDVQFYGVDPASGCYTDSTLKWVGGDAFPTRGAKMVNIATYCAS